MKMVSKEDLISAIQEATKNATLELFQEHKEEDFYYIALITTGEAHPPFLAAWSEQALEQKSRGDKETRDDMKWSYADSPYMDFGAYHFSRVIELFKSRPEMTHLMSTEEWNMEYEIRLECMEIALRKLSEEGIFGTGKEREKIYINVEVMPPDESNTRRATRLNPVAALADWLIEAAE
jgi:Domain of unknown function (DUF4303)